MTFIWALFLPSGIKLQGCSTPISEVKWWEKGDATQFSVWNRDQLARRWFSAEDLLSYLHLTNPDQRRAHGRSGDPAPQPPHANMISSCALYIHEILIYNTLIGIQQGSLAQADQSWGSAVLLPSLDAHLCTFDTTTAGETEQSWWLLSTWIRLSWGGGSNKERNVVRTSEGIIPMHFPFAP